MYNDNHKGCYAALIGTTFGVAHTETPSYRNPVRTIILLKIKFLRIYRVEPKAKIGDRLSYKTHKALPAACANPVRVGRT